MSADDYIEQRERIADIAAEEGYTPIYNRCTHGKGWWHRVFRCRSNRFPDMRIEHDDKSVAVNISKYVLLGAVAKAIRNEQYINAGNVICRSITQKQPEIPGSVQQFADLNGVIICTVHEIRHELRKLLG